MLAFAKTKGFPSQANLDEPNTTESLAKRSLWTTQGKIHAPYVPAIWPCPWIFNMVPSDQPMCQTCWNYSKMARSRGSLKMSALPTATTDKVNHDTPNNRKKSLHCNPLGNPHFLAPYPRSTRLCYLFGWRRKRHTESICKGCRLELIGNRLVHHRAVSVTLDM